MAEVKDRAMKVLMRHINKIKKKFNPERIILFGSRARKDNLVNSDIDLIIVSKKFEGIPWRRRIIDAFGDWDDKIMLEPICYTPDEFEEKKKQVGLVKQAVKEGVVLV